MNTGLKYINSIRRTHLRATAGALLMVLVLGTAAALHAQSAAQPGAPSGERPQVGTYSLLYSFQCSPDGDLPQAGLIRDSSGNLYGTTTFGGQYGYGTVFKVTSGGTETVLHSFAGSPSDGDTPAGNLTLDAAGKLYGVTFLGGESGFGTVYKVTATGTESVLHNFTGSSDGAYPSGGMARDSTGNLYGTASQAGTFGDGVVFKVTAGGIESVLYDFQGGPTDGASSYSILTRDSSGDLYGTTAYGGASSVGTVFQLNATGTERVLYSFKGFPVDGAGPAGGGLLRDSSGNLYGVTQQAGVHNDGVVFRLTPEGMESVLLNFNGTTGGAGPYGSLARDSADNLYGTTFYGGSGTGCANPPYQGCGVLFGLTTTGKEIVLHNFTLGSSSDGAYPYGVVRDPSGNLYGTLSEGGAYGCGAVFKFTP